MGAREQPWEVAEAGLALVGGRIRRAKNTRSEESKADGNSRLKTPLSSRELNSNVHVLREGETSADGAARRGRDGDRCVRIFKQIGYANGELSGKQLRLAPGRGRGREIADSDFQP